VTIQIQFNDPGLIVAGPRTATWSGYMNADDVPSGNETVEAATQPWTITTIPGDISPTWQRITASASDHRFYGPDAGVPGQQFLVSPALAVGSGPFTIVFTHRHSFEMDATNKYDGGVVELSPNGGASWVDIGALGSPGYNGTLFTGSGNPLSGRNAFVGTNPSYPNLDTQTIGLGTTYAGQNVLLRFQIGTDAAAGDLGWEIAGITFTGITNTPFFDVANDPTPCLPLATDAPPPAEMAFALAGANPSGGPVRFRFALPERALVAIGVFDVAGRKVATLADGAFEAGYHDASWNAQVGAPGTGLYFARMVAGGRVFTQRVIVLPQAR
jgi:hypothetical protein